ncbi:MAG: DUF4430 domain-containing protein [Ruminococcus sp.]|nr:DUF4430 domain-containing protein [Ruminococcus sp.]
MQKKCDRKFSSIILCMALIVAMALVTTGCNGSSGNRDNNPSAAAGDAGVVADSGQAELKQLGEGSTVFLFSVVDRDGNETPFEIHTDRETVGEALEELELIAGDESEYGLYVKTVNGITVDYDKDGAYWAFYINGEYALTGVDVTVITEGESYSFKVE